MATDLTRKENLTELTDRIVESYTQFDEINHLGHCPLPRYEAVIGAVKDVIELIYPGYGRREKLHIGNVTYHVGNLIDGLHDKLTNQIARAIMHENRVLGDIDTPVDCEAKGQEQAIDFLEMIPRLRKTLATDVRAAFDGDPACKSLDEVIFCYPGLEAITAHRIAHEFYKMKVPYIPRMIAEWSHKKTGIDIHPGATIGDYFFIDHGTGVVIGETCHIGNHVKIYQGVTLGAISFPKDSEGNLVRDQKRHPTLEDRVVIYANATVLGGNTTIGHDSVLGSSVWVTSTIDPHTTVIMDKPKLRIRSENPADFLSSDYQI